MKKVITTTPQPYPRIDDTANPEHGCLKADLLVEHPRILAVAELQQIIREAITKADEKSSWQERSISESGKEKKGKSKKLRQEARKLFTYFVSSFADPAAAAHQINGRHYSEIAQELFRSRRLHNQRMNSGWRYQFIASDCAKQSHRFDGVSDLGTKAGDFSATIRFKKKGEKPLNLYVSVKNRTGTISGSKWPGAIEKLEGVAKNDRNRVGPYCCVFGIAMESGRRRIPLQQSTAKAHSDNTEIWLSDFFWPFFTNYSYREIMGFVLKVLLESSIPEKLPGEVQLPKDIADSFGEICNEEGLLDELGKFSDPYRMLAKFCEAG